MNRINEIEYLNEIDLEIFEDFNNETRFYPIEEEREKYNIEYLKKLDVELNKIDEKYRDRIYEKCDEIITKFEYILEILKNKRSKRTSFKIVFAKAGFTSKSLVTRIPALKPDVSNLQSANPN